MNFLPLYSVLSFFQLIFLEPKEDIFMAMKGSIHQKDTIIIHIVACNNRAPKYMKPKLTKLERKKTTQ